MLADEPRDEVGILRGQRVLLAEALRIAGAEHRMVAAASLGDVVEQAGQVEHFLAVEVGHEPRAQRIFVCVLRLGEAAQVADHHQDVLVDRVHVEQVVLHLADDRAERRQVLAENSIQVHSPQLVGEPARLAKELDEARTVCRVVPELRVDAMPIAPQRAQRAGRHAAQLRMSLQHHECVEHRPGIGREQRLVSNIEQLVHALETLIDDDWFDGGWVQLRMQVLQQ